MKLTNLFNDKRTIYMFCRDDDGNLSIETEKGFFPYFYEVDLAEGQFKAYTGEKLRKIFVSEPSSVPKNRTIGAYEADIVFRKRYMIDKITNLEKCPIKYAFIDIEVLADELPNVKEAKSPVSCVSIYNSSVKSIQTFYLADYETEYQLIDDFIKYMKKEQFDLWLSWNVSFDYNYLANRFPDFGDKISPIGKSRYGGEDLLYPAGISIVDYLTWFKKITLNRAKSYALDSIAQQYLKESSYEKIDFAKLSPKIKEKNIHDIERMVKLEEKFKLVSYFDEIRRMSKVEWEDMLWNSRVLDMLLLQEAKNQNVILPMKPHEMRGTLSEKEEYSGAFREAFQTGRFFNVGIYDLSSCYPAMIADFCLDPSTLANKGLTIQIKHIKKNKNDDYILDSQGNFTFENGNLYNFIQNQSALLPTVVKKLITLKNNIKKNLSTLKLDSQEYEDTKKKYDAIKSVCNSAYGVFGNRFFRLYSKALAETTTFLVRDLLIYTRRKLKEKGYEVIYADTDGLMINNNTKDVSILLNEMVKQWAKENYNKENLTTDFEYKGYYEKILILTKCRYKGWRKTNKGIEVETKGIEAKRKDSTEFMKKFQIELINKIVNKEAKEKIFEWIREQIKILPKQPLMDIAFPVKINMKKEDYKVITIALRALNNSDLKKRVGEPFYYIFVKSGEYETKIVEKELIMTYDKNSNEKGFKNLTEKRLASACEYINMLGEKEEEVKNTLIKKGLLKTVKVEIKGKPKDVIAFDEETAKNVKNVDWDMMIKRNIIMKLDSIFEAMKWKMDEFIIKKSEKPYPKVKLKEKKCENK